MIRILASFELVFVLLFPDIVHSLHHLIELLSKAHECLAIIKVEESREQRRQVVVESLL
jgi:hypothetical protein